MEHDSCILQDLAQQYAEVAADPINEKRRTLWKQLNDLKNCRPLVMMDQLPWHELSEDKFLHLCCVDSDARIVEETLRRQLYQARNFPADRVFEPYVELPKTINGYHHGVIRKEKTLSTDSKNDVISHSYISQLCTEKDLENLLFPTITTDVKRDIQRRNKLCEMLNGKLPVRLAGIRMFSCGIWDLLLEAIGTDNFYLFLLDEPELMHKAADRMVQICHSLIDQLTELALFDAFEPTVHCTGAYTNDLPQDKTEQVKPQDVWTYGLAQMLGSVSPAMFEEFEIEHVKPLLERFGLVYYGCCEPLHDKIDSIRKIKNVRKISMSPWANLRAGAEEMQGDFVISRKPNPSYLAGSTFDESVIRRELEETREIARATNATCEFILKDVSTVHHQPERLMRWHDIAMQVASE
ncbi:MAG: hypothetical protein RSD01_06095 [Ruthenibacterium sp.]